jgi:hypothetical protein
MSSIGSELDQAFVELNSKYDFVRSELNKITDRGFNITTVESELQRIEAELNDRIDEVQGFDPDELRCDLEYEIERVQDSISYESDRIDNFECEYITESEVDYRIEEAMSDRLDALVCDAVNERAVPYNDHWKLCERMRDLEDRLNKPSFTACALRWLREGPSIKELATKWYAGLRRARL